MTELMDPKEMKMRLEYLSVQGILACSLFAGLVFMQLLLMGFRSAIAHPWGIVIFAGLCLITVVPLMGTNFTIKKIKAGTLTEKEKVRTSAMLFSWRFPEEFNLKVIEKCHGASPEDIAWAKGIHMPNDSVGEKAMMAFYNLFYR